MNNNLNKKAFLSGSWYAISNILLRSVAIITTPIFTRLLTPSDYGIVSNFTAWSTLIVIFINLGMSYSIGNASIRYKKELDTYLASIQLLSNIIGVVFIFFVWVFRSALMEITELDNTILFLLTVYVFFLPTIDYIQARNRYNFLYKQNVIIAILNTVGSVAFSLIFIILMSQNRVFSRILGIALPICLMGFYFNYRLLKVITYDISEILEHWKFALKICIPMIPHAISMIVLNQIDRIQIMRYCGSSDAGLYSFGYSYASILSIILNAISQAWIPWLYEKYKTKAYRSIREVNNLLIYFISFVSILFLIITPEALKILGSESFLEAQTLVIPLVIGFVFQFVYGNYVNLEIYHSKTMIIGIASTGAAILNYILNYYFIPFYGYQIAAITTLIGYLLLMITHYFCYKSVVKVKIYNNKKVFLILFIFMLMSASIIFLFDYFYIRYITLGFLIIIVFIMLYKYRNEFQYFFK